MKLCVPSVDDRGLASGVAGHFGSAPCFTLIDTGDNAVQVLRNDPAAHGHGGCGMAPLLARHGVGVVICRGLGRGALSGLMERGIRVFMADAPDVAGALDAFRARRIAPIAPENACGGGHGHGCGH